ncbi:MAG: FtsX-like permease family protein [Acidobacteria bacterium]|nr:FtsX-like permease family protein [Acidobacteriota bacterium]
MRDAVARQRVSTVILALFSAVAILLAAVGLYGVVSHSVTERTREIGVRMALGAERGQVLRLFVRNGLATAAAGTVIGLAGALALSRSLESLLFEVKPSDPLTFVAVAVLLLAVAMVACYLPARRAAGIDPLLALRTE